MRALVTGGAGFLGSHLCDALLAEGHSVVALDNLLTGSADNLRHLEREPRFEFQQADVCDPFDCGAVEYVFHFASPASPVDYMTHGVPRCESAPRGRSRPSTWRDATRRSSCWHPRRSYGDPQEHPQKESYWGHVNPIGPRSVYDEAKRFAEAATMAYLRYFRVDTRIVRIFNTYGERMQLNDGRVIPNFIKQALAGEDLTVYGDGSQTRSFCYVSDEIEGILRLAGSDEHAPVNIGNPDEFTILECARRVLAMTGSAIKLRFEPLPQDDPRQRRPDISKARTLLGWEPKVDLESGLRRSLEYFRAAVAGAPAHGSC